MKRILRTAFPLCAALTVWILGGVYIEWGGEACGWWACLLALAWGGGCCLYDFAEEVKP